jgi:hypothetical protein
VTTAEFVLIINPGKAVDRLFQVSIVIEEKGRSVSKKSYVNMPLTTKNFVAPLHSTLLFLAANTIVAAQLSICFWIKRLGLA